eukprot:4506199-Alexandrium_andersonii.AAC.1
MDTIGTPTHQPTELEVTTSGSEMTNGSNQAPMDFGEQVGCVDLTMDDIDEAAHCLESGMLTCSLCVAAGAWAHTLTPVRTCVCFGWQSVNICAAYALGGSTCESLGSNSMCALARC